MTRKKTILVVDDEPDLCETFQDFFEDQGYDVQIARDGARALDVLKTLPAPPCIVVCDIVMPVMDGTELYRAMKADDALEPVPIVFMTSDPSRAPPGEPLMKKPIDFDVLLDAVRRYCDPPSGVASP